MPELKDFSLQQKDNEAFNLDALTQEQLLELHAKVEKHLGGLALTEVNLVKETLLQMHRAKVLQEAASKDGGAPLNQRAQVQNSLSNTITQLAKMQVALYNSERVKRIQSATIRVVKTLPKAAQEQFFDLLEREFENEARQTDEVEVTGGAR